MLWLFFIRSSNRGHCLHSYGSVALLTLSSLPVKVFQGYDDVQLQSSVLCLGLIVLGNHDKNPTVSLIHFGNEFGTKNTADLVSVGFADGEIY